MCVHVCGCVWHMLAIMTSLRNAFTLPPLMIINRTSMICNARQRWKLAVPQLYFTPTRVVLWWSVLTQFPMLRLLNAVHKRLSKKRRCFSAYSWLSLCSLFSNPRCLYAFWHVNLYQVFQGSPPQIFKIMVFSYEGGFCSTIIPALADIEKQVNNVN